MYWGGHLAWDLSKEKGVSAHSYETHELKNQSPYYDLLWEANPSEAKRLMEVIWGAHIWDWAKLDFNRHSSSTTVPKPAQWTHEYDENLPCPFPSVGNNWSMPNIAGSLLHTGASLAKLGEDREALIWTKRLAQRWHSACHPLTGLCGSLLSLPQEKRARKFFGHNHPTISDATMVAGWMMDDRYRFLTLAQMQVGEELGDDGLDLIQWASDDLKVFVHYAYDEESLSFRPLLTDGTELNWREFNPGYYSSMGLVPQRVSGGMLWAHTTAYRLTGDPAHWKLLRSVWRGFNLGELGTETGDGRHLNYELKIMNYALLYACLDLHTATKDKSFLVLARRVADNILAGRTEDKCLPKDYYYARTGDESMLGVLHLVAALQGRSQNIPKKKVDRQYFNCAFSGAVGSGRTDTDDRVWDQPLIYDKRKGYSILLPESNEPAISLYEAITLGNGEIVRSLVGQRDNIEDWNGLLSVAVQSAHKSIVEFFLAKGIDINVKGGWQEETPLHHAARLEKGRDIVELLVTKGADLNAKNWKGDTPLQYAAHSDHKDIIKLLLEKGATISNLHIASYMGDLDKAEAFINEDVDINATDGHGYAPLHYASQNNQTQAIELLLQKDADINVKNWSGQTPFHIAISRGYKDIAELLSDKGANINAADNEGNTSLHRAVQNGQKDMVEFLIANGSDLNAKNNQDRTPLDFALNQHRKDIVDLLVAKGATISSIHVAVQIGDLAKVKAFLEEGTDVNAKDEDGATPLHYASSGGNKDIIELLLASGADINANTNVGVTPFNYALLSLRTDIAKLLIHKGADVLVKDDYYGYTTLHLAAVSGGDRELIELIISKGVDVNAKSKSGQTALHLAVSGGQRDIVELLVEKGADVNAKDSQGQTPLQLAEKQKHTEIVELLRKHGAKE